MADIAEVVARLRKVADAATAGPWQTRFLFRMIRAAREAPGLLMQTAPAQDWPDADHMATFDPGLVTALLDCVEALSGVLPAANAWVVHEPKSPLTKAAIAAASDALRRLTEAARGSDDSHGVPAQTK